MIISKKIIAAIALSSMLIACGNNKNVEAEANEKVTEGIDIQKNPIGALKKAIDIGKNIGDLQQELSTIEPVEPVSFKELINYLPDMPTNWSATEPKGETTSFGEYSITNVKRTYSKGDKEIEVTIFDWAYNTGLYAPFLISAEFSQETTEGYNKGIKIGDTPGREEYNYSEGNGSLSLLLEQRFFIQIEGNNLEDSAELRQWWQKIDSKSLAQLVNAQ